MTDNKRSESSSKKKTTKKTKTRYKIHWFRILFAVFLVCAIIGCGVVAGVVFSVAKDTPDLNSIDLDSYSVTTSILDKDGNSMGNLHAGENRVPVGFDEISPNAVNALVAIEDQRFYTHNGVDPIRIGGAMIANIKAGGIVQGGSTITQQLTGLVFLDRTEKSYTRKLKEAILSMEVEKEYSKDEIITHYLNRAYFGGGAYGIEAAAEYFFAKHASELTVPEAAMLAGCIQNPSKWSPIGFPENALKRRNLVLDQMAECEFITKEEAEQYKATEIQLSEVRVTAKENNGATPYQSFINHVIEEALVALELEDNDKALYTGGYIIHTTMDPVVQRRMEEVFNNDANFPNESIQAAMVVTDPETGEVRGIMGGRHQEAARELNRATQSFRQPGSSFKPVAVYAPAFEAGYGPGTVVDDYPKDYSGHVFQNSNRTYSGLTTIRKGIVSSLNVVAVKTMEMTGIDECYKFAKNLGFSKMTDNDRNLSTALGGLTTGVSPLELAGAYGTFANNGVYIEPYAITKITDQNGKVLWEHKTEKKPAMSEQSAYLLTSCLTDAATSGTGSAAKVSGHQTAGKTGTTSDNKDAWFAGYTKHYVGVVWIGYDTPKKLGNNAFGGTLSAPIFSKVMNTIHQGLPAENFKAPSGITTVTIDTKSGLLASELTPAEYVKNEMFNVKHVPKSYSDVWQPVDVCPVSGQKLSAGCPYPAESKVALVRETPWVPVNGLVPADAALELTTECETHAGSAAAASITLSGNGRYGSDGSLNGVELQWTPAQGEQVVYMIHRATSADFSDGDLVDASERTSYVDGSPVSGVTNYYRIVAIDEATSQQLGASGIMSFAAQTSTTQQQPEQQPDQPADTQPQPQQPSSGISLNGSSSDGVVTLTWNAPGSGSYQYFVFRDGAQIGKDTIINGTYFTDNTAEAGKAYSYSVICTEQNTEVARSNSLTVQN
ncbi:MAG: PBP1A family penicillin-binding protein [Peptococcaceae bacterium]|nr:PBP1A family penicillin-binding protein [Peptococcaceae bacterium]